MPDQILVRHFLTQFVESDFSPDSDRHQVLSVTAAAMVTVPLFVTVFMSVKYLTRPLQAPGWTETTALGDYVTFCAASLLVTAAVTLLEWDALGLSPRDTAILGVLPVPHRTIVRAKLLAILIFASGFAVALNAIPSLLHPPLMSVQLPMSAVWLIPLSAAHALSTMLAAAFGFCGVLTIRESVYAALGPARFHRVSHGVQSALLFAVLLLVALVPVRLSDSAAWMIEPPRGGLLEPVRWFTAIDAAMTARVLDDLPRPRLPRQMAFEEPRLTAQFREALPGFERSALKGAAAVAGSAALAILLYLRNARRMHLLVDDPPPPAITRSRRRGRPAILRDSVRRAGLLFAARALLRSPVHRVCMIVAVVVGIALFIALDGGPVRTGTLAAQTLLVGAVVAGFRTAIRTASDYRASWLFETTEPDCGERFREGVRRTGIGLMLMTVALLLPFSATNWGWTVALLHAIDGIAIGWLIVEIAMVDVDRPLIVSLPPSDGVNTVGVVLLATGMLVMFIMAHIEQSTLMTMTGRAVFPLVSAAIAYGIRTFDFRH
jgi:hypothetical protein